MPRLVINIDLQSLRIGLWQKRIQISVGVLCKFKFWITVLELLPRQGETRATLLVRTHGLTRDKASFVATLDMEN